MHRHSAMTKCVEVLIIIGWGWCTLSLGPNCTCTVYWVHYRWEFSTVNEADVQPVDALLPWISVACGRSSICHNMTLSEMNWTASTFRHCQGLQKRNLWKWICPWIKCAYRSKISYPRQAYHNGEDTPNIQIGITSYVYKNLDNFS